MGDRIEQDADQKRDHHGGNRKNLGHIRRACDRGCGDQSGKDEPGEKAQQRGQRGGAFGDDLLDGHAKSPKECVAGKPLPLPTTVERLVDQG